MALPNIYHLRRVALTAQKPCFICYKPTTSVLITPDNRDFFYTCDGHLKDPGFAAPVVDKEEEEAKKRKAEMAEEIERVKKEFEEKQKARLKKKKGKGEEKEKETKGKGEEEKGEEGKDERERDEKIKAIESGAGGAASPAKADDGPRIFALHRNVYQMRVARIQNAQQAKRTAERLKNPSTFPAVPTGNP